MAKFTKRYVEGVATDPVQDVVVWDDALPGFGLRVKPSGRRTYIAQYRTRERRSRRVTLGQHGLLTVDEARQRARRMLVAARDGKDPAQETERATFAEVADRYVREHAEPKKKPRSAWEDQRLLRHTILPAMGRRDIRAVNREDIAHLHHSLRSTPVLANRSLALLSKIFSLCEQWGLRDQGTNPCRGVQRYRENRRERYLSEGELTRLGQVLAEAERAGTQLPAVILAIRLLVLTGARLGEVLGLQWSHVDLDRGVLRLPDSKTGAKVIVLGRAATELLAAAPLRAESPYVCPGAIPGRPVVGIQKAWQRLRREAGLEDVRLHDLRHTYASVGAGSGLGLPLLGALLGHRNASTTQRYAHLADDPQRRAADAISSKLERALRGESDRTMISLPEGENG